MIARTKPAKRMAAPQATRASVTFPSVVYADVEALAKSKKVSVAWIVRDAVERYVAEEQKRSLEGRSS
jgi:metal-responsive CopG/Arc/MetJ family transcriptional regulator